MSSFDQATSRRRFLQFLAASPLFAYGGLSAFAGEGPTAGTKLPDPIMWAPLRTEDLIKRPEGGDQRLRFRAGDAARTSRRRISATWPRASTMR